MFFFNDKMLFQVDDPYLDIHRACLCVQTLLDKFANKQIQLTRITSEILREKRIEYERKIEESTKASVVEKLGNLTKARELQRFKYMFLILSRRWRLLLNSAKACTQ